MRLLPAQYVKPYLKRQKNDAADAEAICEAVTRPTMRFVPVKTPEQQSVMMLHRVRLMLNRQRTQISNALRAHLSEFGVVAPVGRNGFEQLLARHQRREDRGSRPTRGSACGCSRRSSGVVKEQILENDRRIRASARETELGRRLMEIPGVGPLLASAFVATVADPMRLQDRSAMPLSLDRPCTQAELERGQGAARQHLAGRQPLSAPDAGSRRHGGHPPCRAARYQAPVARPAAC